MARPDKTRLRKSLQDYYPPGAADGGEMTIAYGNKRVQVGDEPRLAWDAYDKISEWARAMPAVTH
jgi:hypothetical protein